ncbi:MAG: DUF1559 domain-containing protein [Planctomycetia bacterium]
MISSGKNSGRRRASPKTTQESNLKNRAFSAVEAFIAAVADLRHPLCFNIGIGVDRPADRTTPTIQQWGYEQMQVAKARRPQRFVNGRSGFTLVELLVVITIIGVLAGLILPAVQAARRAASRAQCLNNIRNVGLGLTLHQTSQNKFPASGVWDNTATWDFGSVTATTPMFASTDLSANAIDMKYSWVVSILSYLDRSDIYDSWEFTRVANNTRGAYTATNAGNLARIGNDVVGQSNINVLTCPDDITRLNGFGNLSYVVNGGYGFHWTSGMNTNAGDLGDVRAKNNLKRSGLFFLEGVDGTRGFRYNMEKIRDGGNNTVMLAENINAGYRDVGDNVFALGSNWASPHPYNTSFFINATSFGGTGGGIYTGTPNYQACNEKDTAAPPNIVAAGVGGGINSSISGTNEGFFPYPNSLHAGGVNVVMADGSAKFLLESIDSGVWARIVTPDGTALTNADGNKAFEPNGPTQLPVKEDSF